MANIGKVNVQLSVDPAGTKTGVDAAINDLQRFQGKLKSIGGGSALFGGALGLSALPQVPTDLKGALTTTFGIVDKGSQQILALSASANRLGVSMRDAAAMEVLFGDKAEAAFTAMDHLNKGMGALRAGSGGDFQKTIRSLGLDDKAVSKLGTTEAAKQITARIGALNDSFDKANATSKIFGRSANEISPVLQRLSTGFDAAAEKADRFGLVVSEEAAQNIRALKRSLGDVKLAFEGVERQSAATFAKPLGAVSDTFSAYMNSLRNQLKLYSGQQSVEQFNRAEVGIWKNAYNGPAKDAAANAELQNAAQNLLQDTIRQTTDAWDKQFESLGRGAHISQTFAAAQQYLDAGMAPDKVKEMMQPLQGYARALDEIDRIKSAPASGLDIFQDADRKIGSLFKLAEDSGFDDKITKRAEDAMRGIHVELERMAETARSTLGQEMQTPAEKLSARLEYLKNLYKGVADAAGTFGRAAKSAQEAALQGMGVQTKTPFETFQENAKQLLQMQSNLPADLFARGMTGIYDNLLKSSGLDGEAKLPSFAAYGSQEAFSTINRFYAGVGQSTNPTEVLQAMRDQQAAQSDRSSRLLQDILDALRDQSVVDF